MTLADGWILDDPCAGSIRACAYIVYDVYIKVVLYSVRGALHVER